MDEGNHTWGCKVFALFSALAAPVFAAELSFSRVALDTNQLTAEVSYPSSLIQSRWDVYGAPLTGGWSCIATELIMTGSVATSWSPSTNAYRFLALGRQALDADDDGLDDAHERLVTQTDPSRPDTDSDGISDGDETLVTATDPLDASAHPAQTILTAQGPRLVDGAGRTVLLRGVNIGGWLAYEQWMVGFQPSNQVPAQDDYNVRATFDSRFGTTGTTFLLNYFRDRYFSAADIDDLKGAGFNLLRVPFQANILEDETNTYVYKTSGWARLDWVVSNCAARQMYCLLDMHGVPGCQNPWDHSGRIGFNQVWYNTGYQARAVALWSAIAQRYATNAAVVGYDLINEPFVDVPDQQGFVFTNLLPLYDRLYDAVRSQDTAHLVFIESTEQFVGSNDACWWMPVPASMGWTNVVYEFHNYDGVIGYNDFSFAYQKAVADKLVRRYVDFAEERQVPVYVGEFNAITPQNMDYFLRRYDANGISWSFWNYKHVGEWVDSSQPWSPWGLYYSQGQLGAFGPNVSTNTWSQLLAKMDNYAHGAYSAHAPLFDVVRREAARPDAAEASDFYLSTFTAHGQDNKASPDDAWPWLKVESAVQNAYAFVLTNHHGRLVVNYGTNVQLRLKSRPEADARFTVNDATGCWFSVDLNAMGAKSGVQLAAMRDATTGAIWWAMSPGVIARAIATNGLRLEVYAKRERTNGFGTNLFASGAMSFSTGATLALFVDASSAALRYNGTDVWSGAHGIDFGAWPNGAAGIVECDNLSGGSLAQTTVEFDNLKAWRPNAAWSGWFSDDFSGHSNLLQLLAAPEHWSLRDFGQAAGNENAYYWSNSLVVIPKREDWGITWMNPRRDFGTDLRYSPSNAAAFEFRATFARYTNGAVKLCFLPESMPRETYWLYDGPFVFAEIRDQPGGLILFHIFRQQQVADLVSCASNFVAYTAGLSYSFQLSTNQAAIYYGTNLVVSAAHGLTNFGQVYANGLFPHLEFQNYNNGNGASFSNGSTLLDDVVIRPLPGFTIPQ